MKLLQQSGYGKPPVGEFRIEIHSPERLVTHPEHVSAYLSLLPLIKTIGKYLPFKKLNMKGPEFSRPSGRFLVEDIEFWYASGTYSIVFGVGRTCYWLPDVAFLKPEDDIHTCVQKILAYIKDNNSDKKETC